MVMLLYLMNLNYLQRFHLILCKYMSTSIQGWFHGCISDHLVGILSNLKWIHLLRVYEETESVEVRNLKKFEIHLEIC